MSGKEPTKNGNKWTVDRDPDEVSYYAADITQELIDRATALANGDESVEIILVGVALLDGPEVQVVTKDEVQRTYVVVFLGGTGSDPPADWRWTARVSCANGERFDKTTWFNRVDT